MPREAPAPIGSNREYLEQALACCTDGSDSGHPAHRPPGSVMTREWLRARRARRLRFEACLTLSAPERILMLRLRRRLNLTGLEAEILDMGLVRRFFEIWTPADAMDVAASFGPGVLRRLRDVLRALERLETLGLIRRSPLEDGETWNVDHGFDLSVHVVRRMVDALAADPFVEGEVNGLAGELADSV